MRNRRRVNRRTNNGFSETLFEIDSNSNNSNPGDWINDQNKNNHDHFNKSSLEKLNLPKPKGYRVSPDGRSVIITEDETFNPELRRSFKDLSNLDGTREFGASYDFENNRLKNIDISSGSTNSEDGRASVKIRVDREDEFYVHSHPPDHIQSPVIQNMTNHWNQPSGQDLFMLIYQKMENPDFKVQAGYILQPDGRYIRYSIVDDSKLAKGLKDALSDWQNLTKEKQNELLKEGYANPIDYKIESMYAGIYFVEKLKAGNEFTGTDKNGKPIKNRDYIPSSKQWEILPKRTFFAWCKWIRDEFGIEVKRMPKDYRWKSGLTNGSLGRKPPERKETVLIERPNFKVVENEKKGKSFYYLGKKVNNFDDHNIREKFYNKEKGKLTTGEIFYIEDLFR